MDAFSQLQDPVLHAQAAVMRAAALIETVSATTTASQGADTDRAQSPLDEPIGLSDAAALVLQKAGARYGQAQALNFAGIGLFYQGRLQRGTIALRTGCSDLSIARRFGRAPRCRCRTSRTSTRQR